MKYAFIIWLVIWTVLGVSNCHAASDDLTAAQILHKASLEQLSQFSTLDATYNIFDGLVNQGRNSTASGGISQANTETPAVTSVITKAEIAAMGAGNLDEVLRTVPGLYIDISGLGASTYIMRGLMSPIASNFILMLNGIPVRQLANNTPLALLMHGGMSVHNIERIEIIRGPASALYGADAVGGVINIITRDYSGEEVSEVGMRVGSFDSRETWFVHHEQVGKTRLSGFLEYHTSDGHRQIIEKDLLSVFDAREGTTYSYAPGAMNTFSQSANANLTLERSNWRAALLHRHQRYGFYSGFFGILEPNDNRTDFDFSQAELSYHNLDLAKYWDLRVRFSLQHFIWHDPAPRHSSLLNSINGLPIGTEFQVDVTFREIYSRFESTGIYTGFADHVVLLGAGYNLADIYNVEYFSNILQPEHELQDMSGTAYAQIPEVDRRNHWFLAQDSWLFAPNWELTTGMRYDHFSDFGSTLSPRLSLVWQTSRKLSTKLLYGRAFLAPGVTQIYGGQGILSGNPDLEATKLDALEGVLHYQPNARLNLSINAFIQRMRNQITLAPFHTPAFRNSGALRSRGVEFEMRWKILNNQSFIANYSRYRVHDEKTNHTLPSVPAYKIFLRHDWQLLPNWYLDTQWYRTGDFQRAPNDSRTNTSAQTALDLSLRYKQTGSRGWDVAFGVRNIFDQDNRDPTISLTTQGVAYFPDDYPLAGRSWFGELNYRF